MSLYEMFAADPLHQIEHGVWGRHIWLWYKAHYLSKGELDTLDKRSPFPPDIHIHVTDCWLPVSWPSHGYQSYITSQTESVSSSTSPLGNRVLYYV